MASSHYRTCHVMTRCSIDWAMAAKTRTERYYSARNVATKVSFDTEASVHDRDDYDVDRIFWGFS